MKRITAVLGASFLLAAYASLHRHSLVHYGQMNEWVENNHVQYKDRVSRIGDEKINRPKGEKLSIRYSTVNDSVTYKD